MFFSDSQSIGFDIGRGSLRIAKLRKTRQGWDVPLLRELSQQDNVNLLYKQIKEGSGISAVNMRDILLRPCEIQIKKAKDVFAALDFHIEPLLPYALDKAVIQAQIVGRQEHTTLLNVVALRKDHLTHHLSSLKLYAVEPEVVTSKMHALAALAGLLPAAEGTMLIVHEGEEEVALVLMEKGKVLAARGVDVKKDLDATLQKALLSMTTTHKSKTFDAVYFFGRDSNLKTALQKATDKTVLTPSIPSLSLTQDELIQYSLAIGCALSQENINFRQKEFAYPHPFRRYKKPLFAFFSLSLLFAFAICLFSELSIAQKKKALEHSYTSLLQATNRPQESIPHTSTDYLLSLSSIEKEERGRPMTYPLLPQVPKVKELLSWLSALPEAKGVVIESLHYQMVKRPDFNNRHSHYAVRVDLEISTKNANSARLFQEALKNSNPIVNTAEEVVWNPGKEKYKAAFYLKDKTKYE